MTLSLPNNPLAVLFDLDGTLLDTAADMAHTLNLLRTEHGHAPLAFNHIRPHVSDGAAALVRLAFGETYPPALLPRFLDLYAAQLATYTRLFPGMDSVLAALDERQLPWGVVTNKPERFSHPLLARLGLDRTCRCLISGDTLTERKPHPAPLLHAAQILQVNPRHCLYVGDAPRDMQASIAAGMRGIVAGFGYVRADDNPHTWGGCGIVQRPEDLLDWLT